MIKKIFSILLVFCIMNFSFLPALAENEEYNTDHISTSHIINAKFKTDLNAKDASKGQIVQFVSTQDCMVDGVKIPEGTIFNGEIKNVKKGRFGYRRAKVRIVINEMILPSGETQNIKAYTKRHVLKGPAAANIGKGIITLPVAVVTGVVGVVVIFVEAVTIVGIIVIGPTTYLFGEAMGKLTHGINYKKHEGDAIQLKIKSL